MMPCVTVALLLPWLAWWQLLRHVARDSVWWLEAWNIKHAPMPCGRCGGHSFFGKGWRRDK